jgi:hypothetical protein
MPTLYFIPDGRRASVLDNAFTDWRYPVLDGHRSAYGVYRTLLYMQHQGWAMPDRIDFSLYTDTDLVGRVLDDLDATISTLGAPSRYGLAETWYYPDTASRQALGDAFAAQGGRLASVRFWTTPYSPGEPAVPAGYPFAFGDYLGP